MVHKEISVAQKIISGALRERSKTWAHLNLRSATLNDCGALTELEAHAWQGTGVTELITLETFEYWATVNPEGLIVATLEGHTALLGYTYVGGVQFEEGIIGSSTWEHFVKEGPNHTTHNPHGNSLYGVSIATYPRSTGAFSLLLEGVKQLAFRLEKKYVITFSRMPRFTQYLELCRKQYCEVSPEAAARAYVILTMLREKGEVHPRFGQAHLNLFPLLEVSDPVISGFYHKLGMRPYSLEEAAFEDEESGNFAAFMVGEFPAVTWE